MKNEEVSSKFWRKPIDAESFSPPRGEVHILANRCKGCGFCVEFCPRSSLEASSSFNEKGYHPPVKRDDTECVNCGLCELICPELAIYTKRVNEIDDKD